VVVADYFSPETIAYISDWCVIITTILAILGAVGAFTVIGIKKINKNSKVQKNKGSDNRNAQSDTGHIDQGVTQNVYNAPVTILNPGVNTPTTSPTASPVIEHTEKASSNHDGDGNE